MSLTYHNTLQIHAAAADHVLEGTIRLGGQEHFYLEPNGCIVLPTEDDEYTLISSTQAPTKHQVCARLDCIAAAAAPMQGSKNIG
jgi:xanthine dehydrogenase/oxidase